MNLRSVMSLLVALSIFTPSTTFSAAKTLDLVESEVYKTSGSKTEIASKAKPCIIQNIQNNPVQIRDSSTGSGGIFSPISANAEGHSTSIEADELFIDVDLENGTLSVNNRVDFRSGISAMNVKSVMSFMAKEDRFKVRHSNIQYLQKSTGHLHNDGYQVIFKSWGTGWKKAEAALAAVSEKIAACVIASPEDDW